MWKNNKNLNIYIKKILFMDTFRRIIESNYDGFRTDDAISIIKDSAEVTRYVENNRAHLAYVSQLMNDKIIDEAMGRVRQNGDFVYDGDGGFTYKSNSSIYREIKPSYNSYNNNYNNNSVANRLELMEQEMRNLRRENDELRNKIEKLK